MWIAMNRFYEILVVFIYFKYEDLSLTILFIETIYSIYRFT